VIAGVGLTFITFDPIPKALRPVPIDEDQEILVMQSRNLLMNGGTRLGSRNRTRRGGYLEDVDATKLRDLSAGEFFVYSPKLYRLA
jgi:hypothetical protein